MGKTVIFEKMFGVDVSDFSTTEEIDEIVEKKIGRKMELIKLEDHGIAHTRGNVFKLKKYDIDSEFNKQQKLIR